MGTINRSARKIFYKSEKARSVEKCMDDLHFVCGVCYCVTNLQPPMMTLFPCHTIFSLWGRKDCMTNPKDVCVRGYFECGLVCLFMVVTTGNRALLIHYSGYVILCMYNPQLELPCSTTHGQTMSQCQVPPYSLSPATAKKDDLKWITQSSSSKKVFLLK